MSDDPRAVEALLAAVARRLAAADRLVPVTDDALLPAIAATAATVLEAQAASIALHEPTSDRLVFAAAAGPAAGQVVGLAIDAAAGIAGYVFATGQPLAVADVTADPRFDRTVADATGYVPRSLLATPLIDERGTLGVLEVLDRRGGTFTMHDLEVAAALAREATVVARSRSMRRDAGTLLRDAMAALAGSDVADDGLDATAIEVLVERAIAGLPVDDDDPTWRLADRLARLREVDPDDLELALEWIDALIRHRGRTPRGGSPGGWS